MGDRSRVPKIITEFDAYITKTDNFLQAIDPDTSLPNWQRLELKSSEASWWNSERVFWRDTLYPKHSNVLTRTTTVNKQVEHFRAAFKKKSARILDKIAVADAGNEHDEATFNLVLKKNRKKPGYHTVRINEGMALLITHRGSGWLEILCRVPGRKRAGLPGMANSVQLAYSIGTMSVEPTRNTQLMVSTRARFILQTGAEHIGQYIYIYARWYHTKHPLLAGTWSEVHKVMIA
jgi:hypothetical protein